MAQSPQSVTHAFTLKSRWLTGAILHGNKPLENRSSVWKPGWYAVHTGLAPEKKGDDFEKHVRERCDDDASVAAIARDIREGHVAKGAVAGLCRIAHALPVEAAELRGCEWALGPVCMIISETIWLARPIPHKGALGTWPLDAMARFAVQAQANTCATGVHSHASTFPPNPAALQRMRDNARMAKRKRAAEEDSEQPTLERAVKRVA